MRVCIFEDQQVRGLEPLALTRPASDLLCGLTTLAEKQVRYFSGTVIGHLCRPVMADVIRSREPVARVNDPVWLRAAPTVLVNARWVPPPGRPVHLTAGRRHFSPASLFADGSHLGTVEGEIAYVILDTRLLPAVSPTTLDDCLADWLQSLPAHEAGGTLVHRPWDLVALNGSQLLRDFEAVADRGEAGFHPSGLSVVGPADQLVIDPSARIDPMVVADTTRGPVVVGARAVVHSFTRLEGPCSIGEGTVVLGASVRGGTTIGPDCRIGGEVEASILLGHANKYHDGFLGHSYVGEWANLAAGTSTADLRYDYRPVSVAVDGREVPTDLLKVGTMFGDHARTGLGVKLDCGTTIGPFAQVLPTGGFVPRCIAAMTRVGPGGAKELSDVDRLLAAADTAMRRRGRHLTPAVEAVYRSLSSSRQTPPTVLPLRRSA
jgi:UDP-N-acetylglucosamine diphosphorylase/glucosamine-1-phosphate N-acetyltransferase